MKIVKIHYVKYKYNIREENVQNIKCIILNMEKANMLKIYNKWKYLDKFLSDSK